MTENNHEAAAAPESAGNSVYIKGLPEGTTPEAVSAALSKFGAVADLTVPGGRDFGFVVYETEDAAKAACEAGSVEVGGTQVTVEPKQNRRSHSIYISSVGADVTEDDVTATFSGHKAVSIQFRERVHGAGRYAFVEFESAAEVQDIISKGPYKCKGQDIEIEERKGRDVRGRRENDGEGGPPRRMANPPKSEHSVYITGFPQEVTEDEVKTAFSPHGAIVSTILRVKFVGEEEGVRTWAFVEFDNPGAVAKAVEKAAGEGISVGGTAVTVEARKSEPTLFRGRGGRRGRGRGRGRGGGRRPPHANDSA